MYHSVIKRLAEPRVRPLLPLITIARSPLTKSVIGNTTLFSLASLGARDDGTFIVEFKIARAYFGNLARVRRPSVLKHFQTQWYRGQLP
jgi:hypothetical protein